MTTKQFLTTIQDSWSKTLPVLVDDAKNQLLNNQAPILFDPQNAFQEVPNTFGVYLFMIKPLVKLDYKRFLKHWDDSIAYAPTPSENRFNEHTQQNKNATLPFYIGKSEKLKNRIKQHCYQDKHSSTYGLKLSHRHKLLTIADFTYSFYEIKDTFEFDKSLIQFIMTNLEMEIRNDINPWIGKQ